MEVGGKLLAGVAATVALALAGHVLSGETFISGLEQQAETELAARGLDGATVRFGREPLSRSAVLDGELPDDAKQEALNAVIAIPGVSGASWQGEEKLEKAAQEDGSATPDVGSATLQKISECQNGVDKITESRKINFRSGSAYVSPESNQILDKVAAALKGCEGLTIAVEGHTDNNGDRDVNKAMSQERADRIKAGLVDRGISQNLVSATGYGSARPRAKGSDAAADAQNRRIEFQIGSANGSSQNDAKAQQGE
ncbi:MAG: OmpA family protein [Parasphingorhabdus sp.]